MLCVDLPASMLVLYVFLPAQPEQELVMVLWGSAAVYGLRLPKSINFYDMSESSSHVPRSRGRVIAVRQRQGGPSSVTPVINLQRGTAALASAVRTNQDIIAFAVLFYRSCQWSCHPRQTSQCYNPNNTKIFLIWSVQGFRMRNHRHPGCNWFCILFSDKSLFKKKSVILRSCSLAGNVHTSLKVLFNNHRCGMTRLL